MSAAVRPCARQARNVWVCRMNADKMGIIDSKTGGPRSCTWARAPSSGVATAPRIAVDYALRQRASSRTSIPRQSRSSGVRDAGRRERRTVRGDRRWRGRVFANEIQTDTVAMLDPKTGSSRCSSCRRETSAFARRSSTRKGATGTWARKRGLGVIE